MPLFIHYHFRFASPLLSNPVSFQSLRFQSIPFFKLYPMRDLGRIRDELDVLSCDGMPHAFQKIMKKLIPQSHIAKNHYREELISLKYCSYNRQSFFVRAYRLLHNDFCKVEVTLHSDTLGEGKYLDLTDSTRAAATFFRRLEANITPINPLGEHRDDYFFLEFFQKKVRAMEKSLKYLNEANNKDTRGALKKKLSKELKYFEANAMEIAEEQLKSLKRDEAVCSNLCASRQLEQCS